MSKVLMKKLLVITTFILLCSVLFVSAQNYIYADWRSQSNPLTIKVQDASNWQGYQLEVVNNNPSVATVDSFTKGDYLTSDSASDFTNEFGTNGFVQTRLGSVPAPAGSGDLLHVNLNILTADTYDFELANVLVGDVNVQSIDVTVLYGFAWDDPDMSQPRKVDQDITFYTTLEDQDNTKVPGSCTITIDGRSSESMADTGSQHEYTTQFDTAGTYSYTVQCLGFYNIEGSTEITTCLPGESETVPNPADPLDCTEIQRVCDANGEWGPDEIRATDPQPAACNGAVIVETDIDTENSIVLLDVLTQNLKPVGGFELKQDISNQLSLSDTLPGEVLTGPSDENSYFYVDPILKDGLYLVAGVITGQNAADVESGSLITFVLDMINTQETEVTLTTSDIIVATLNQETLHEGSASTTITLPGPSCSPSREVCDGVDNDCDSVVDENPACSATFTQTIGQGEAIHANLPINPGMLTFVSVHEPSTTLTFRFESTGGDSVDYSGYDGTIDVDGTQIFYSYNEANDQVTLGASFALSACTDADGDFFCLEVDDCNDANSAINPEGVEVCDSVDNDCNAQVDEGGVCSENTYYCDGDSDSHTSATPSGTCQGANCIPAGCSENQGNDCNDANAAINPGATEVCDLVDNNCNAQIDEGVQSTFYLDNDGDNYGDNTQTTLACNVPANHVVDNTDCNDNNGNINPGAAEVCNAIDDNCDGQIDEGGVCSENTYYCDSDSDSFISATPTGTCNTANCVPQGCSENQGNDCNDANAAINPGATESCNAIDDNCNAEIDEGVQTTYYLDSDSDTFGDPAQTTMACSLPNGHVANNNDCNDNNAAINPNAAEICDTIDNNCNAQVDEGNVCADNTYYCDGDSDTYNSATPSGTCQGANCIPAGCSENQGNDCNDVNAAINPGATEICDTIDNNCNAQVDEGNVCSSFTATITSPVQGELLTSTSVTVTYTTSANVNRVHYILDAAAEVAATTGSFTLTGLSSGAHTLTIFPVDDDGARLGQDNDITFTVHVGSGESCTTEGETKVCGSSIGQCQQGQQTCRNGQNGLQYSVCEGHVPPASESCGNDIDEDCDGTDLTCPTKSFKRKSSGGGSSGYVPPPSTTATTTKETCNPFWVYGDWGACSNSRQSRTATDLNKCDTTSGRAQVVRSCTVQPQTQQPAVVSKPTGTSPEVQQRADQFVVNLDQIDKGRVGVTYDNTNGQDLSGVSYVIEVVDRRDGINLISEQFPPFEIKAGETYEETVNLPTYLLKKGESYNLVSTISEKGRTLKTITKLFSPESLPFGELIKRLILAFVVIGALVGISSFMFLRYIKKEV